MVSFKKAAIALSCITLQHYHHSTEAFHIHRNNSPCIQHFASSRGESLKASTLSQDEFQQSLLAAKIANDVSENSSSGVGKDQVTENGSDFDQLTTDVPSTQNAILRVAASTDRGQYATTLQKDTVSQLVEDLERTQPNAISDAEETAIPSTLAGTWELLYSNTQLFRSSPFFLAGRSTCTTAEELQQFEWFCNMHRAALAISNIGIVRQIIKNDGKLVNEFEVKVGAVPFLSDFLPGLRYSGGLPFTIDGAIVSSADATPMSSNKNEWEIYMDTVEIKGSNIPILRSILDSTNAKLRSRDLSKFLEENVSSYETPRPLLRNTFVDENMRIVRDVDGNIFVYGRVSASEEPTDYSGVLPDLGVTSLLEGFNDAVTKIYL